MKIAIVAAGFTPSEADRLRRAMATFRRVGTIQTFKEKMIEGMATRGYDRDFAERCFRQIEGFGEYGFPESHAASFALLVYASCWMKCRYPDVFAAAMLNSQPIGFYAPAQLVRDAREHGVEMREVDVNLSDWDCTLESLLALSRLREKVAGDSRRMRAARTSRMLASERGPSGKDGAALIRRLRRHLLPRAGEGERRIHPRHISMAEHIRATHAVRLGLRQIVGVRKDDMRSLVERRGEPYDFGARPLAQERARPPPRSSASPTPTPSARSASTGARPCGRCAASTGSATRTICRCSPPRGPNATRSPTPSCRRCRSARMWSRTTGACLCR